MPCSVYDTVVREYRENTSLPRRDLSRLRSFLPPPRKLGVGVRMTTVGMQRRHEVNAFPPAAANSRFLTSFGMTIDFSPRGGFLAL